MPPSALLSDALCMELFVTIEIRSKGMHLVKRLGRRARAQPKCRAWRSRSLIWRSMRSVSIAGKSRSTESSTRVTMAYISRASLEGDGGLDRTRRSPCARGAGDARADGGLAVAGGARRHAQRLPDPSWPVSSAGLQPTVAADARYRAPGPATSRSGPPWRSATSPRRFPRRPPGPSPRRLFREWRDLFDAELDTSEVDAGPTAAVASAPTRRARSSRF